MHGAILHQSECSYNLVLFFTCGRGFFFLFFIRHFLCDGLPSIKPAKVNEAILGRIYGVVDNTNMESAQSLKACTAFVQTTYWQSSVHESCVYMYRGMNGNAMMSNISDADDGGLY